jgi:hypothetical protein
MWRVAAKQHGKWQPGSKPIGDHDDDDDDDVCQAIVTDTWHSQAAVAACVHTVACGGGGGGGMYASTCSVASAALPWPPALPSAFLRFFRVVEEEPRPAASSSASCKVPEIKHSRSSRNKTHSVRQARQFQMPTPVVPVRHPYRHNSAAKRIVIRAL